MSKSHCSSQLDTWNAYDETGNSLFVNNSNIKIQENGNEIKISTENFNWNQTIYLKNDLQYGASSAQAIVELKFNVSGCNLVGLLFNPEIPTNNITRMKEYYMLNGFPYQLIQ